MKLSICIPTFNRNKSLEKCVRSLNKIKKQKKIKINIIIVDNSKNKNVLKIKKKLIEISKYRIIFLEEKKRGIVFARNKYLKKLKIFNPDYVALFDDDCIIDKYWLVNSLNTINSKMADVVTGPQIYLKSKNKNYSQLFEKKYGKEKIYKVKWAASNNVLINYKILKKNKIYFDENLNKFGVGEDQLFFLKINSLGYKIFWNKNLKVYEKIHRHRQSFEWITQRSLRLGVLGHYIDKSQYGNLNGLVINYFKSIYYLLKFLISIINVKKSYFETILNYFIRFCGRLIGPLVFKRMDFYKK